MSTEDDRIWVDALAGRSPAHGAPAPRNEGELLRGALRARQPGAAADAPPAQNTPAQGARAETLIARAARDGLIGADGAPPLRQGRRKVPAWRPLLAAAALACVAIGIAWQLHTPSGMDTLRGASAPIVRLTARDPADLKRTILGELRRAGVEANGYEALGVEGIDADLPQPLSPAVRRVLVSHRIPEPRDGVLRIEIRELR